MDAQKGARPVPDFDRTLLSSLERAAAIARLRADGPDKLDDDYEILNKVVDILSENGLTKLQIYEDVMGRLWENTSLMKRGQNVRNNTILLTRAMLIQIIAERGISGAADGTAKSSSQRKKKPGASQERIEPTPG
jgi:hypothetical protein